MKAKELIKKLQTFDENREVILTVAGGVGNQIDIVTGTVDEKILIYAGYK